MPLEPCQFHVINMYSPDDDDDDDDDDDGDDDDDDDDDEFHVSCWISILH